MKAHLVVNMAIVRDGAVLLERTDEGSFWKFPGGHVEEDENPVDTVRREAREELNVSLDFVMPEKLFPDGPHSRVLPTPWGSFVHTVARDSKLNEPHDNIIYSYVVIPRNEPSPQEGQAIRWFVPDDLTEGRVSPVVRAMALSALAYASMRVNR